MVYVPLPIYPFYIKKEDAKDVVAMQRKQIVGVLLSFALVIGILQYQVSPNIVLLYSDLNITPPTLVAYSLPISGLIILISLIFASHLLVSKPNYKNIDSILKKYKSSEMIKTSLIIENKYKWQTLLLMILYVTYMVFAFILPIYTLSSRY